MFDPFYLVSSFYIHYGQQVYQFWKLFNKNCKSCKNCFACHVHTVCPIRTNLVIIQHYITDYKSFSETIKVQL